MIFAIELARIMSQAKAAGALQNSGTFIQFWQAGVPLLERELNEGIQFAYNVTSQNTGEVYDQVAFCAKQMVDRIMQDVRRRAAANDKAFGGGYRQ